MLGIGHSLEEADDAGGHVGSLLQGSGFADSAARQAARSHLGRQPAPIAIDVVCQKSYFDVVGLGVEGENPHGQAVFVEVIVLYMHGGSV